VTIRTSDSIKAISGALLAFQGAVDGVGKTAENPGFKKDGKALKYANLESVIDTAKPQLQAVGVVFLQSAGAIVDGVMAMTTRLIHAESGEWIEGTMDICLGKKDPQGVGSAQTYSQRYHLMAMLGLPPVDDDAEGAIDRNNQRPIPERSSEPRVAPTSSPLLQDRVEKGTALTGGPANAGGDTATVYARLWTKMETLDGDALIKWQNRPEVAEAFKGLPEKERLNLNDAINQKLGK
jgi:hypothetical protein